MSAHAMPAAGGTDSAAVPDAPAPRDASSTAATPPRYALAFDVGGTDIKTAFVAPDATIIKSANIATARGGAEALVAQLHEHYGCMRRQLESGHIRTPEGAPLSPSQVCNAVGVAIPGLVDESRGMTIKSANLGWGSFPMRQALEDTLGVPVMLGHDLRSGALGEARFTGRRNCVFVAIGTGIAAGIVLDGQVLNRGGTSGEIGQILFPNPDRGYPSRNGDPDLSIMKPVEQIASAAFTGQRYATLAELSGETPDSKEVFAREREGDPIAHHVVETGIAALGYALAATIATLGDLEVIIGGGQSKEGPAYLKRLQAATAAHLVNLPEPRFSLARFGSRAQLLGAAARVFAHEGIALNVDQTSEAAEPGAANSEQNGISPRAAVNSPFPADSPARRGTS